MSSSLKKKTHVTGYILFAMSFTHQNVNAKKYYYQHDSKMSLAWKNLQPEEQSVWREEARQLSTELDRVGAERVPDLVQSAGCVPSHVLYSDGNQHGMQLQPPSPSNQPVLHHGNLKKNAKHKKFHVPKLAQKNAALGFSLLNYLTYYPIDKLEKMREKQRHFAFEQIGWHMDSSSDCKAGCQMNAPQQRFALNESKNRTQIERFVEESSRQSWLLLTVETYPLHERKECRESIVCVPGAIGDKDKGSDTGTPSSSRPASAASMASERTHCTTGTGTGTGNLLSEEQILQQLVPAEITLARFSLRHGIKSLRHWRFERSAHSEENKRLYKQTYTQLRACVLRTVNKSFNLPVLYVEANRWNQTVAIIENYLKPAAGAPPAATLNKDVQASVEMLPNTIYCIEDLYAMLIAPMCYLLRLGLQQAPLSLSAEWAEMVRHSHVQLYDYASLSSYKSQNKLPVCELHESGLRHCSLRRTRIMLLQLRRAIEKVQPPSLKLAKGIDFLCTPVTPVEESSEQTSITNTASAATISNSPLSPSQSMDKDRDNEVVVPSLTDARLTAQRLLQNVRVPDPVPVSVPSAALHSSNVTVTPSCQPVAAAHTHSQPSREQKLDYVTWTAEHERAIVSEQCAPLSEQMLASRHVAHVIDFVNRLRVEHVAESSLSTNAEYTNWWYQLPRVARPHPQSIG